MTVLFWILGIVVWLVAIYVTYVVARSKGRNAVLWAILAVFFTWITLLVVALLPPRRGAAS